MSLRVRLALMVVAMVAVALLLTGLATYTALRSFLVQRIDQQLPSAVGSMAFGLHQQRGDPLNGPPDSGRSGPRSLLPLGTYGEILDSSGAVVASGQIKYADTSFPLPALPKDLAARTGDDGRAEIFTVGAKGRSSVTFRVLVQPDRLGTGLIVVAMPLSEVGQTLGRLVWAEGLLGLLVLAVLAVLSWWLVRRSLRPLEHFGETATAIADGDLSRRVESTDPRTEVGRLGITLNAMLVQIEQAFAQRLASEERLRRFLADASHELRTPLTSIRGYAELFRRGAVQRPKDLSTSLCRIEQEAARMGVLVEEMLLLARLDRSRPLEVAPLDLCAIARDAAQDARVAAPDRAVGVEAAGPVTVLGDEVRLRQVASNLLTNALVHTPGGTAVDVAVTVEEGHAVLSVADRGAGLSERDTDKVFEPFYRADPSRSRDHGGSGLGLSIVAAIAAVHGGSAMVTRREGGGALFRVLLPLAPRPSAQLEEPAGSQETLPAASGRSQLPPAE